MSSLRGTPYRSPAWRAARRLVLYRDRWQCQLRNPGCTGRAQAVDHIQPWDDGGAWYDPTNLRATCTHCNSGRANRRRAGTDLNPTPSPNW